MSNALIPSAFLFRYSSLCRRVSGTTLDAAANLSPEHRVPSFGSLDRPGDLERPGGRGFADLRIGWNDLGLFLSLHVSGKRQPLWCRSSRIEDSDGLQIWIDTRDTHNVHRASRFCHRIAFLAGGAGRRLDEPGAAVLAINRAKESPRPISEGAIKVASQIGADGYRLRAHIPARVLTGYDPTEHPKLGFFYVVIDRELGWQTYSLGPEFPIFEDPSLWGTLELDKTELD